MNVTWNERYGIATAKVGIVTLSVNYGSDGYSMQINNQELKKKCGTQAEAKAYVIATAQKWVSDTLNKLES